MWVGVCGWVGVCVCGCGCVCGGGGGRAYGRAGFGGGWCFMLMVPCGLFHQVMVLAELFLEMLQRDFGYRIYKMLLSLPEKVVAPPETEKEEAAKEEEVVKEEAKESKDEVQSEGTAAESDAPPVSTSPCTPLGHQGWGACRNTGQKGALRGGAAVLSALWVSLPLAHCSHLVTQT